MKSSKGIYLLKNIVFISQFVIIAIIILTLLELYRNGTYNLTNLIILFSLSYGIGLYCIVILVLKFLSWFRSGREVIVPWICSNNVYLYSIHDYFYYVCIVRNLYKHISLMPLSSNIGGQMSILKPTAKCLWFIFLLCLSSNFHLCIFNYSIVVKDSFKKD